MVVLPVDGVVLQVGQGVVHPPHVPLEPEAEPSRIGAAGHPGPGGGFLGDHRDSGVAAVGGGVELPQEVDGIQVLPPAVGVGLPLAGLPGVVQVEHGSHRVHAQPVDVELFQPEQCVGDQKVADLGAAVVEDQRVPVGVDAAARVRVLVQGGAVEAG